MLIFQIPLQEYTQYQAIDIKQKLDKILKDTEFLIIPDNIKVLDTEKDSKNTIIVLTNLKKQIDDVLKEIDKNGKEKEKYLHKKRCRKCTL